MSEQPVIPQEKYDLFIEWPDQEGITPASLGGNIDKLKQDSEKAINIVKDIIRAMADELTRTVHEINDKNKPDEMEIGFSLKLDLEGGAIIPMVAKTTVGGQFDIKFKWILEKPNRPTVLVSETK